MKRIAIIHNVQGYGGSVISLTDVINMLRVDFSITVYYSPMIDEKAKKAIEKTGVKTVSYKKEPFVLSHYSGIKALSRPGFWLGVLEFINNKWWLGELQGKHDIIFLNSSVLAPLGAFLNKHGMKTVCFDRETYNLSYQGILDRVMKNYLSKQSAVIFLSQSEKNHYGLKIPTYVIQDVLDVNKFNEVYDNNALRKKLMIHENTLCLLFMGGVSQLKGTLCLLEAYKMINDHSNMRLLLLGDTSCSENNGYATKCINIIKEDPTILNIGNKENVGGYYSISDILIFPSSRPHQARPLYEAGYFSVPAIMPDFEQTAEYGINGFNVITFKPNDPVDLSEKIELLCNNVNMRKQLGENNKIMCYKEHWASKIKKALVNAILELLQME